MSMWTIDGKTPQFDFRGERIAAGTIGGEHAIPESFAGRSISSIIDDADPRILYGSYTGAAVDFTQEAGEGYTQRGTQTVIGGLTDTQQAAAVLQFTGSSIGVMGATNPLSGIMTVYVDGVATAGRLPIMVGLNISLAGVNNPVVRIGDTSITTLSIPSGFPASGSILIGNEIIAYSSKGASTFNTAAVTQNHYADETVYLWGSTVDLGDATNWATKRLLYYNPFLAPGQHRILIVVTTGSTGYSRIYFDGFITGSLVGSSNLFTQTGTITASTTLDANGHSDLGSFVLSNSDISIIGILGYTQIDTELGGSGKMVTLGVRYGLSPNPILYVHNGTGLAAITLKITFMYIGETL